MKLEISLTGDIDDGKEDLGTCLRPLVETLASHDISMTIPVVASALLSHPAKFAYLRDAGIEIAGHGDVHEPFVGATEHQVVRLVQMKQVFEKVLGEPPLGFRAPFLAHDANLYTALEKAGFEYDSSRVARDMFLRISNLFSSRPLAYRDPVWRVPSLLAGHVSGRDRPRPHLLSTSVIEFPVFELDDWFFFESDRGPRLGPKEGFLFAETWLKAVRHFSQAGNVLVLQAHPKRISPSRLKALEYFLEQAHALGSEFCKLGELARRHGTPKGGGRG